MENNGKKPTSWGWIIFWFIIFWPIGLYLLIKRQSVDKCATLKSSKGVFIASYILMGFGVIYIILAFEDPEMLIAAVLFGGGGILINWFARRTRRKGERYKKYISMVVNQNQTQIDNIASAAGVDYDTAMKDLQKMIDSGYFVGAYIDVAQREIILAKVAQDAIPVTPDTTQPLQERVVTCGSCGANNKISTQVGECEYCASPLQ